MIIEELKKKFPDMPNLRVRDIRVDKVFKRVYCVVSYPEMPSVDPSVKAAIKTAVSQGVPSAYRCDVQLVNDKFNERSFLMFLTDHIKKKYPLFANIKSDRISVQMDGFNITVTFLVSAVTKKNMEVAEFIDQLQTFFLSYTCYRTEFVVNVDETAVLQKSAIEEQERLVQLAINRELLKPQRYFNVTDVVKHIGKEIGTMPMYISDIRAPMDSCVICGKISDKELRAVKNNPVLKLCKFNLTDGSGATMPCIMFARFQIEDEETIKQTTGKTDSEVHTIARKQHLSNDKKMKMLAFLGNDLEVLVRGKVVYSQFSQRLELQMYDICKCRIQPINLQPKFERRAAEHYVMVHPTPIEEYRQLTLMEMEEKTSLLSGRNIVVLYANVTGYNITKDKIFAVSGVRIVDGHLKEKMFTLVSPEINLSDAQLKEVNATEKQLMLSPTITEIISDLFKFLGNSILVGNNLPSLLEFLNYYGAPLGYNFKNRTAQTVDVLSKLFENSTVDVRPTYSQMEEVTKALKINCKISNSCQDLALAAAKCMVALAEQAD